MENTAEETVARHPSLPKTLGAGMLENWLKANAKEKFEDEQKIYLTDEEINLKARESSGSGAEIQLLKKLMDKVKNACEKGNKEELVIEIPVTQGKAVLDLNRAVIDAEVARGYNTQTRTIFGIPNSTDLTMEFFTTDGTLVPDRTSALSAKEKYDYVGPVMHGERAQLAING